MIAKRFPMFNFKLVTTSTFCFAHVPSDPSSANIIFQTLYRILPLWVVVGNISSAHSYYRVTPYCQRISNKHFLILIPCAQILYNTMIIVNATCSDIQKDYARITEIKILFISINYFHSNIRTIFEE